MTIPIISFYGVRGSMALPKKEFMEYGGNTSSYTIRTPDNTLIFLDAGTGIQFACDELNNVAENVCLFFSHMHADHTMGLGMSSLPWICFNPAYKDKKISVKGPKGTRKGLNQFYGGEFVWPVIAHEKQNEKDANNPQTKRPTMPGIDFENLEELVNGAEFKLDNSTNVKVMCGNHPVNGGVLIYRFDIKTGDGIKSVVYATDNEFDFLGNNVSNPNAERLKKDYVDFINGADILIADAQYSKEEYVDIGKVKGFGHSYTEQIIDLASQAGVRRVYVTHHGKYTDDQLKERETKTTEHVKQLGLEEKLSVIFAKECSKINL